MLFLVFAFRVRQGLRRQRHKLCKLGRREDAKKVAVILIDPAPGHTAGRRGLNILLALFQEDHARSAPLAMVTVQSRTSFAAMFRSNLQYIKRHFAIVLRCHPKNKFFSIARGAILIDLCEEMYEFSLRSRPRSRISSLRAPFAIIQAADCFHFRVCWSGGLPVHRRKELPTDFSPCSMMFLGLDGASIVGRISLRRCRCAWCLRLVVTQQLDSRATKSTAACSVAWTGSHGTGQASTRTVAFGIGTVSIQQHRAALRNPPGPWPQGMYSTVELTFGQLI